MDRIIKFFLSDEMIQNLPQEVSFLFAIMVILGFGWLFLKFVFNIIKYYWETIRPNVKLEKETAVQRAVIESEKKAAVEQKIDRRKEGQETMGMIIDLHDKMGKINSDYAGKFSTRKELEDVKDKVKQEFDDVKDKISKTNEDISNIKGQMGIR